MNAPRRAVHGPVAAGLAVPQAPNADVVLSRPSIDVLRVRVGAWTAEIRGAAVVIPEQRYTNGSDLTDLMTCVAIAQTYVPRPSARTASTQRTPQALPAPPATAQQAAAAVLRNAAHHATTAWDRRYCDLYACLKRAWGDHGQAVAYTALTAPLRHLVEGGNLLEFNDTHSRADVVALFQRAAELVERHRPRKPSRKAAA